MATSGSPLGLACKLPGGLAVALAAARHGCAMIVDSTRRGKRFPDALTKTVPIWCAVINRAVAEERGGGGAEWAELRLMAESEKQQPEPERRPCRREMAERGQMRKEEEL